MFFACFCKMQMQKWKKMSRKSISGLFTSAVWHKNEFKHVVYFFQLSGALVKITFSTFFSDKSWKTERKSNKFDDKFRKKNVFFKVCTITLFKAFDQLFCVNYGLGISLKALIFAKFIKKHIFAKICIKFVTFFIFQLFCTKNAKNDYFNQRLGCSAPKCWSKYATEKFFATFQKYWFGKLLCGLILWPG